MAGRFVQVLLRAVVGNARKRIRTTQEIQLGSRARSLLGCHVSRPSLSASWNNGKMEVTLDFDVDAWFTSDDTGQTLLHREPITVTEAVGVDLIGPILADPAAFANLVGTLRCADSHITTAKGAVASTLTAKVVGLVSTEVVATTRLMVQAFPVPEGADKEEKELACEVEPEELEDDTWEDEELLEADV
ncbi:MAG: outer spore coat protein CotE [Firmicutes bacterium]|nr:outer spore coat protein CotE [Bacillota bacterium]